MITKTTRSTRPNTSVPFFNEALTDGTVPGYADAVAAFKALFESGKATNMNTVSEDGLTQTREYTFVDLATLSQLETLNGIAIQNDFNTYRKVRGFKTYDYTNPTEQALSLSYTGIDQPFTVTTTYVFPEVPPEEYDATQIQAVFANSIESYEHYGRKVDILLSDSTVTVIHQYANSADQTANPYLDMFYVPQLAEKNVVRSIEYALV